MPSRHVFVRLLERATAENRRASGTSRHVFARLLERPCTAGNARNWTSRHVFVRFLDGDCRPVNRSPSVRTIAEGEKIIKKLDKVINYFLSKIL